jgi:hypothetical protein
MIGYPRKRIYNKTQYKPIPSNHPYYENLKARRRRQINGQCSWPVRDSPGESGLQWITHRLCSEKAVMGNRCRVHHISENRLFKRYNNHSILKRVKITKHHSNNNNDKLNHQSNSNNATAHNTNNIKTRTYCCWPIKHLNSNKQFVTTRCTKYSLSKKFKRCKIHTISEYRIRGKQLPPSFYQIQSCTDVEYDSDSDIDETSDTMTNMIHLKSNIIQTTKIDLKELIHLKKEVECSICCESISDPVCLIKCGHRFCRQCIKEALRTYHKYCPNCRQPCGLRAMRPDNTLTNLIQSIDQWVEQHETLLEQEYPNEYSLL